MAIFAVNGACGACKASVLAMATSHVSSVSLKRAVSFNGGRSSRMLQVRSKSLNRRGINHSCPPAHLQRSRLGKLAADSGLTWKRSAGHSTSKNMIVKRSQHYTFKHSLNTKQYTILPYAVVCRFAVRKTTIGGCTVRSFVQQGGESACDGVILSCGWKHALSSNFYRQLRLVR